SLAEDAVFLREAIRRGARLRRVANAGLFVYVRHGENAWRFALGVYLDRRGWLPVSEPGCLEHDRALYVAHAPRVTYPTNDEPLETCIMPTSNRRRFVAQSIHYFVRQDYPHRELLVLDGGDDGVKDLVSDDARIRYVGLAQSMVLGAKRSVACELAGGAFV